MTSATRAESPSRRPRSRRLRAASACRYATALAAASALLVAVAAAAATTDAPTTDPPATGSHVPRDERLVYDWHLGGFVGTVAGLFLPSRGQGVMSVEPGSDDTLRTELMITSPHSAEGEFWRYGSRIRAGTGHALEAWNSYRWRDEAKEERSEVEAQGVRDIVSGIYHIRRELPRSPQKMSIWSDGKIYLVLVIPRGVEQRKVNGRKISTLHYTVKGDQAAGGRKWKGSLEIWLARDPAATPVEMHIRRSLANLNLEIQELP